MSPNDIDPSTLNLNPRNLSKVSKKDLADAMTILQDSNAILQDEHAKVVKKYSMSWQRSPGQPTTTDHPTEKAKSIIHARKTMAKAKNLNNDLILRPPGRHSHDYNIQAEMGASGKVDLTEETYGKLLVSEQERLLTDLF